MIGNWAATEKPWDEPIDQPDTVYDFGPPKPYVVRVLVGRQAYERLRETVGLFVGGAPIAHALAVACVGVPVSVVPLLAPDDAFAEWSDGRVERLAGGSR